MAIAIGDIHGCLKPLQKLVSRLPESEELVFLGDYIDRGPDSAGVVDYLISLASRRSCRFLKGNHEEMMLNAISSSQKIVMWLFNGGEQTLKSYGVEPGTWVDREDRGRFLERHRDFMDGLEIYHEDQDNIFVHAGIDITISDMIRQETRVLLWVRESFVQRIEQWEGKLIVFGHTPTHTRGLKGKDIITAPRARGIDTGCCYGGYLTAYNSKTDELYQESSDFKF